MKKLPDIIKFVSLESVGENTGHRYVGSFRLKVLITHDQRFAIERTYKEMLPDDVGVIQEIKIRCGAIAELEHRVVEAPLWWRDSRNGRDLIDSQPLYDMMIHISEKYEEWKSELQKEVAEPNVPTEQSSS